MTKVQLCRTLSMAAMLARAPSSTWAFVSSPAAISERHHYSVLRQQQQQHQHRHLPSRCIRWGPKPVLASANPDVKDTSSVISDMEHWASLVSPETYMRRDFEYKVSAATSLPEIFFDFWKAVSNVIDEHRSTREDHSLRKLVMFVAPFCEELKDYETMEHVHQLLQQSARDGGCNDFGTDITHVHYHPNYRFKPRPRETWMASCHAPHPSFSIDVLYKWGGLKSLQSMRAAAEAPEAKRAAPPRPRADVPPEGQSERALKKNEEWATLARSSLESLYNTAACYGEEGAVEDDPWKNSNAVDTNASGRRGVPESSQEILQATQAWLRGVLKDAVECDSSVATTNIKKRGRATATTSPSSSSSSSSSAADVVVVADERSTAFKPPTAAEVTAAIAAANNDDGGSAPGVGGAGGQSLESAALRALDEAVATSSREQEAQDQDSCLEEEEWDFDEDMVLLPGKELVKRMSNIAQYLVVRSRTAEEVYADVWEVVNDMADRAANHGCSIPTEDYSSSSSPCYSAVMVTPDLATYNAESFFRFQEILNRGLKHLPMEHDISVEAFHPETVSESSPMDHHFLRSPYPTLHICYHGLREEGTALHPAVTIKKADVGGGSGSRKNRKKKRNSAAAKSVAGSSRVSRGGEGQGSRRGRTVVSKGASGGGSGGGGATAMRGGEEETETASSSGGSSKQTEETDSKGRRGV